MPELEWSIEDNPARLVDKVVVLDVRGVRCDLKGILGHTGVYGEEEVRVCVILGEVGKGEAVNMIIRLCG